MHSKWGTVGLRRSEQVWRICTVANRFAIFGPAKTSGDRALTGGPIRALWMRDLADALEMGLRGSLVVVAVVLASLSASSSGTHKMVAG